MVEPIEPTENELHLIAAWAHDLGSSLWREEANGGRAELERQALRELEAREDALGSLSPKHPRIRAVWCWNFVAGWKAVDWHQFAYETPVWGWAAISRPVRSSTDGRLAFFASRAAFPGRVCPVGWRPGGSANYTLVGVATLHGTLLDVERAALALGKEPKGVRVHPPQF